MRISDWSSDVCSSDLWDIMIVQGQLVVRAVDYLSSPYGMMDPYEEIRKAADRSRQVHSTIGHLVQQADVGSSRLGVENGENIVPQLCNWAAAPGRSEEHTSELQSLMRSTYAVYCL